MAPVCRLPRQVAGGAPAVQYSGGMAAEQVSARVDSWIWSVRLTRTRSIASDACRGGHVRVNGVRVKPAHAVRVGDEVRLRHEGHERIVVVSRLITKRVGAAVAAECYVDKSPPPPPARGDGAGGRPRSRRGPSHQARAPQPRQAVRPPGRGEAVAPGVIRA
ncbi:hypothetical protein GCM10020220_078210 [Nonomuraea rubra]